MVAREEATVSGVNEHESVGKAVSATLKAASRVKELLVSCLFDGSMKKNLPLRRQKHNRSVFCSAFARRHFRGTSIPGLKSGLSMVKRLRR